MLSGWAVRAGVRAGWVLAAVTSVTAAQAAPEARILYFEPLSAVTPDRDAVLRKSGAGQLRELKFDAFGRRFALSLDANTPLTEQLVGKTSESAMKLYRGHVDDVAGSWVRLATKGESIQGMFWDGAELYVIEPASQVHGELARPLDASAARTVIFRLADVAIDANEAACAVEPSNDE